MKIRMRPPRTEAFLFSFVPIVFPINRPQRHIKKVMTAIIKDAVRAIADETPLCRTGSPSEVAKTMLFLASDDASFITGQVIGVNGGLVI